MLLSLMRCAMYPINQINNVKTKLKKSKIGVQKQVSVSAPSMRLGNMGI